MSNQVKVKQDVALHTTAKGNVGILVNRLGGKSIKPIFLYVEQAEALLTEEFQVMLGKFINENQAVLTKRKVDPNAEEIARLKAQLAELQKKAA